MHALVVAVALMWSSVVLVMWRRVACVDVWKAVVVWRQGAAVWIDVCWVSVGFSVSSRLFAPWAAQIGQQYRRSPL